MAEPSTSLRRLDRLSAQLGVSLFAKRESEGATGTQKDRIVGGLVRAAVAAGAPGVTVGTCGNLGAALAFACRAAGLPCTVFVPANYQHTRADEMQAMGARVFAVGSCYEDAVTASQDHARGHGWFDANPVGAGGEIAIGEYTAIVDELIAQGNGLALGSIWVPVGNGTCAAGIHGGLARHGIDARVCVVGSVGNTALTASLAAGRELELDPASLRETLVNEPLVNWRSLHAREAMAAVIGSRGWSYEASDAELIAVSGRLRDEEQLEATPSGAAGLAGLQAHFASLDSALAHVLIVTA